MENRVLLICIGVCFLGITAATLGFAEEFKTMNGSITEGVQDLQTFSYGSKTLLSKQSSKNISQPVSSPVPTPYHNNSIPPPHSSYPQQANLNKSRPQLSDLLDAAPETNSTKKTIETNCTIVGQDEECVTETTVTTLNKTRTISHTRKIPKSAGAKAMDSHVLLVLLLPVFVYVT